MSQSKLPMKIIFNDKLCILGTSHIYEKMEIIVHDELVKFNPDLVLLELDSERYELITFLIESGFDDPFNLDYKALAARISELDDEIVDDFDDSELFAYDIMNEIHDIQQNLGEREKLLLGIEFFTAICYAREHNKPVELIDFSISEITNEIAKIDPSKLESFLNELKNTSITELQEEYQDLVDNIGNQEHISKIRDEFKQENPEIYEILIENRDANMSNRIWDVYEKSGHKKLFVIIGAGHFDGIIDNLQGKYS
ncbi:MAG: hypothetical protein GF364_09110 [Candidatus Lokiarchaeota archaeon]|nr:hypothetical protein [Candidatus Lokiarchaeota archaeon]